MAKSEKIAVIGSGFIGRSWATLFASAGYRVSLYDVDPNQVRSALEIIKEEVERLEKNGLLRGKLSSAEQIKLISPSETLKDAVKDAKYVQECVFERIDLKRSVFEELDKVVSDNVILASSTSCFPASQFTDKLKHRSQVIVAHPVNPPYLVPLVELVPAPWTNPSVVTETRNLMNEIGQKPVSLHKEVPGFVLNRVQYAIIAESWRLVQDGVISVEDIDTVMSEGLGMRYAFLGPLETAHLNANGFLDYCNRYGNGIYNVTETFGPNPRIEGETAKKIHDDLCKAVPLEKLAERRAWRDENLATLAKLKQK